MRTTGVLNQLQAESRGAWLLGHVDIQANPRVAELLEATSLPLIVAFAHGRRVETISGSRRVADLRAFVAGVVHG